MRTGIQAMILCAVGSILGLAGNALTPRPAPLREPVHAAAEQPGAVCHDLSVEIPRISFTDAAPLCIACKASFVDARSAAEYAGGHVNGALHLAPGEDPALLLPQLRSPVIVYDGDAACAVADKVAGELRALGVADVRVLSGAWPGWLAAGGPGESGACAVCGAGR
ncbi:MAG: rhodanese-like domain-containing protein [Myxococcales bacterium]